MYAFPIRLLSNKNGNRAPKIAEGNKPGAKSRAKAFAIEREKMGELYPQSHEGVYQTPPTFPASVFRWDAKKLTRDGIDIVSEHFNPKL